VHSHNSSYIYSVAKSNRDSIEFSLSIAEQRVVGFILAWSLASLQFQSMSYFLFMVEVTHDKDVVKSEV